MLKNFKNKKVLIPTIIILGIIIYIIISKLTADNDPYVEAETVKRRTIIHKVNASGKIQPEEEVQITSTITGWITEITVNEGDTVKSGQHLISIDEKQYRPVYNQALSQVKSASANLRKIESQLERTKALFSQKLISKQDLEQIETSYEIALSQSEQANANLLRAEDELSKTRLTAPKYGIVTSLTKEKGEMAVGGMFNPMVLMTIADLSQMEVLVDVNENDVINIDVGDTTEIEIDAFPDTIFYGLVSEIAHTAQSLNMGVQEQVTNFKVKVRVLSPPNKIRPGMSSTVDIITETLENVISIPIQSLTSRPKNYKEMKGKNKRDNNKKWSRKEEGDEEKNNFREETIEIVFILENQFENEIAPEGKKYALVRPVIAGIDGESHYAMKKGIKENELIVTGSYRVLSKELQHGMLVNYEAELDGHFEKNKNND